VKVTLITTGRRSGAARPVPLYAWPDGAGLVVVGSRGGAAADPAWVHNLRAVPKAVVRRGRDAREVEAREVVEPIERERLWALVTAAFPLYATYQGRTRRQIPLFVLSPAPPPHETG
jgi:F420H(2)-dependent quinone reductase